MQEPTASTHRYTLAALRGDAARAAFGLGLSLFVLLGVGANGISMYIFLALTLLFAAFALHTFNRALTVVAIDGAGIAFTGPRRQSLAWDELRAVKLSFFRTRRGTRDGWLQLKLKGAGGTLALDSHIDDFGRIARLAYQMAERRGLALSPATKANFQSLGVEQLGWGAPKDWVADSGVTNRSASP